MDLEQAFFLESPLTWAVAFASPLAIAAAAAIGCGKKREPVKEQGRKKGAKGAAAKAKSKRAAGASKRSTAASSKSKSKKKGSKSKSKSSKSSKSKKAGSKSGKSSKTKRSAKSSKDKGSKEKSSKSKKTSSKSKKSESSLKDSTKKTVPTGAGASKYVEADKKAAEFAHVQATAALMMGEPLKTGAANPTPPEADQNNNNASVQSTQRSSSQKATQSQGSAEPNVPNVVTVSNDATHEIKMEPAELRWSAAGGLQKITIFNQTHDRQAIKVKCSDNNVYRVNPVFAFIDPGQSLNVDVMRQNGTNKVDKIVFITSKANLEETNPRNIFKPGIQGSTMVLPLLATQPPTVAVAAN